VRRDLGRIADGDPAVHRVGNADHEILSSCADQNAVVALPGDSRRDVK
jgi:hypothetical protein